MNINPDDIGDIVLPRIMELRNIVAGSIEFAAVTIIASTSFFKDTDTVLL